MRVKLQLVICADDGHEETVTDIVTLRKDAQRIERLCRIYGPPAVCKGYFCVTATKVSTACIYPYMDSSRPASRKLMMSDSEPRAYIRPLLGERPPGPDVLRSLSSQRPHGICVPRI